MSRPTRATAFAPASVANVAVGFDILGFSMPQVGDKVTVARDDSSTAITIESITGTGIASQVAADIPIDPTRNTAAVALSALRDGLGIRHGYRISIEKGIPLGSGMGGSAASAVGAVVAAAALVEIGPNGARPSALELIKYALAGETVASGAAHADNVAPCLLGGLTLAVTLDPLRVVAIPTPAELQCVLVHPHLVVETRQARSILKPQILMSEHVHQSAYLAAFVSACHSGDLELLGASMLDILIEPQRAELIPGFYDAKRAAIEQGALGFSISGSGPSLFAWTTSKNAAERVRAAILRVYGALGVGVDSWVAPVQGPGARVIG